MENLPIGSKTIVNTQGIGIGDPPPSDDGPGETPLQKPAAPVTINNVPVDHPDIQASFPGGDRELITFFAKNLRSPKELQEEEVIQVK